MSRGPAALLASVVTVVLAGVILAVPVPFASESPGPAVNVLGTSTGTAKGTALITISGRRTYPTSGALDLTTVSQGGGPGDSLDLVSAVRGWLDPNTVVLPRGQLFPAGTSAAQDRRQGAQEMSTSQENATAAALDELGIAVPTTIAVEGTAQGSGASGRLKAGDVITQVGGTDITDLRALHAALARSTGSVVVTVRRAGERLAVSVPTSGTGAATTLGIYVDPSFAFPFHVGIQVDRIGGPSAGTMFALGIIDRLTPGSLTGGDHIAGTGTVDPTGAVGAIGGIRQKMIGAADTGATAFLAPAANCDEVVGHVPKGLQVVKISTLHQARGAVDALAKGKGSALPTCTR